MGSRNNTEIASLTAIGDRLKQAREKKGVTIDQAQRQTHIHSTVLTALESGRSDEVLTPTYVKSFLKKYAAYLELDQNQIIKEYSSIHPEFEQPNIKFGTEPGVAKSRIELGGYVRFIRNLVLAALCIFAVVLIIKAALHFTKTKKPSARKVSALVKQPRTAAKAPRTATVNKKQQKQADAIQFPSINIPASESISLRMKVKEQVYIGVRRDGVLLFRRLLPKGTTETFTAEEKLNISIAKARAVELTLNGQPLGSVGKGTVNDLEITRKNIRMK